MSAEVRQDCFSVSYPFVVCVCYFECLLSNLLLCKSILSPLGERIFIFYAHGLDGDLGLADQ